MFGLYEKHGLNIPQGRDCVVYCNVKILKCKMLNYKKKTFTSKPGHIISSFQFLICKISNLSYKTKRNAQRHPHIVNSKMETDFLFFKLCCDHENGQSRIEVTESNMNMYAKCNAGYRQWSCMKNASDKNIKILLRQKTHRGER